MYYKLLSDIDGVNIIWEDCYGRHWESFTNYDDLDKAFKENQALMILLLKLSKEMNLHLIFT